MDEHHSIKHRTTAWRVEPIDLTIDPASRKLRIGGQERTASPLCFRLLQYFVENPRRVIGHDELLAHVWSPKIVEQSAIKRAIADLRRLLNEDSPSSSVIRTVPREGYVFEADPVPKRSPSTPPARARSRTALPLAAAALVLVALVVGLWPGTAVPPMVQAIAVAGIPDANNSATTARLAQRLQRALFLSPQWRVIDSRLSSGWSADDPAPTTDRADLLLRGHGSQHALLVAHRFGEDGSVEIRAELHSMDGSVHQVAGRGADYNAASTALIEAVVGILPRETGRMPEAAAPQGYDSGRVIDQMIAGRFSEAANTLQAQVQQSPQDRWAWTMLAKARLALRDPQAALAAANQAIELEPAGTRSTNAMRLASDALIMLNRLDQAEQRLAQAQAMAQDHSDFNGLGETHLASARLAQRRGDHDLADSHYTAAMEAFGTTGNEIEILVTQVNYASFLERSGRATHAIPVFRQALHRAKTYGLANAERVISANLALAVRKTGQWGEAEQLARHALALAREQGQRNSQAIYRLTLAIVAADRGQLGQARQQVEQALEIVNELQDPRVTSAIIAMDAHIEMELGHYGQAVQRYGEALEHAAGDSAQALDMAIGMTGAECEQGGAAQARQRLSRLIDDAAERDLRREQVSGYFHQARHCAPSAAAALEYLEQGLPLLDGLDEPALTAMYQTELGYFLTLSGDHESAREHLARALRWKSDYPDALGARVAIMLHADESVSPKVLQRALEAVGDRQIWRRRIAEAHDRNALANSIVTGAPEN